jgi:hypothetical protein
MQVAFAIDNTYAVICQVRQVLSAGKRRPYSSISLSRSRSSANRISHSRGFARAITVRENEAKILHPTTDNDAIRLASTRSHDLIWQMPSKSITLQSTSSRSHGSTGRYMDSVRLNRRSRLNFSLAFSSCFRTSRMRNSGHSTVCLEQGRTKSLGRRIWANL